jgi:hypothetical protein
MSNLSILITAAAVSLSVHFIILLQVYVAQGL